MLYHSYLLFIAVQQYHKRVKEILSENIENMSQEEFEKLVTDDIIEFKNLSFSYDGTDKYIF